MPGSMVMTYVPGLDATPVELTRQITGEMLPAGYHQEVVIAQRPDLVMGLPDGITVDENDHACREGAEDLHRLLAQAFG